MKRLFRMNGLSIVLFALFFTFLAGQTLTGYRVYEADRLEHGAPAVSLTRYLRTGHFGEAVFENWESEFLQISFYVLLTIWLRQRGSSESKRIGEEADVDKDPRIKPRPDAPGPVKRGGIVLRVYENSLGLAFATLFVLSLALHALTGSRSFNEEQRAHGSPAISSIRYAQTSQFWFESFQNWQSEFLATGALVLTSVFLRQRGSPESKPVDMPNSETP